VIKYFSKEEALRTSNINSKENILNTFLNYDAQAMIKYIHNRELRRSGPIYILQEIPNYQSCTVPETVRNNLSISCMQGLEAKLPEPRGAPPHGIPHLSFRLCPCLSPPRQAQVYIISNPRANQSTGLTGSQWP